MAAPASDLAAHFFVTWHIDRSTARLHATLSRRVATGAALDSERADRDGVGTFREGLPPLRLKTYAVILILATFTVGRVALDQAGPLLSALPTVRNVQEERAWDKALREGRDPTDAELESQGIEVRRNARTLVDRIGDAVGTDVSSLGKTLDAFAGSKPEDIMLVLAGVSFALYVVTRPFAFASFRLKRLLMNLRGDRDRRDSAIARWHAQRSYGAYADEREAFDSVGMRPPREPPIDLLISALFWSSLPVALGIYLISSAPSVLIFEFSSPLTLEFDEQFAVGSGYLAVSACRSVLIGRSWRRRNGEPGDFAPYEVEFEDGSRTTVRDPLTTGIFAYFIPYYAPIWWWLARSLRCVGRSHGSTKVGRIPVLSALAFTNLARSYIVPPLVSMIRGERQLRSCERSVGRASPSAGRTIASVAAVLAIAYIIRQSPVVPAIPLVFPYFSGLPFIDYGGIGGIPFDSTFWSLSVLLVGVTVVATFAAYFQNRLNQSAVHAAVRITDDPSFSPRRAVQAPTARR